MFSQDQYDSYKLKHAWTYSLFMCQDEDENETENESFHWF